MPRFLKFLILFLFIALFLAFVMIPAYEIFIGDVEFGVKLEQIKQNILFESFDIWKRVFIFNLALWCGKAIIWAISVGPIKTQ